MHKRIERTIESVSSGLPAATFVCVGFGLVKERAEDKKRGN